MGSILTARLAGIDAAPQAYDHEHDTGRGDGRRVPRGQLEQQTRQLTRGQASDGPRGRNSNQDARQHHRQCLTRDHPAHVRTRCTERHSNADFGCACRHGEGQQAVEAYADEREGHNPEHAGQDGDQALAHERRSDFVGERANLERRHVRINRLHSFPYGPSEPAGIVGRTNVEHHLAESRVRLEECLIHDGRRRFSKRWEARVLDDADDVQASLDCIASRTCELEQSMRVAKRIATIEELSRERLVDDHDPRRIEPQIVLHEVAALHNRNPERGEISRVDHQGWHTSFAVGGQLEPRGKRDGRER